MSEFDDLFLKATNEEFVKGLHEYARVQGVPIINDEGLMFLLKQAYSHKPKKILEIGCAIGYSSILMHKVTKAFIDTIERNEGMAQVAKKNIKNAGLDDYIKVHLGDALLLDNSDFQNDYDMIFVDAAKAQYQRFIEKYEVLLKKGGMIICDNLAFHELVNANPTDLTKNVRGLVRKINNFKEWLKDNPKYDTHIHESIGDGMSISIKKE